MRKFLKVALLFIALGLGVIAWDVYQLRGLRPPADRSFQGFERAGRVFVHYRVDDANGRLYAFGAQPLQIVLMPSNPVLYVFDRRGELIDWTPGDEPGMISGAKIRWSGREATPVEARSWFGKN